jgi:hypothetical protein
MHHTEGVTILVADTNKAPLGAALLLKAFSNAGVTASAANSAIIDPKEFALYIGLKPQKKRRLARKIDEQRAAGLFIRELRSKAYPVAAEARPR